MIAIAPEECEFYTPNTILERVYKVFDIDLDPCCPVDCKPVKAKNYFTKNDDGLSQLWFGNVFCNPPYGSQLKLWIKTLTSEYTRGGGENMIVLCPNKTDTKWYREIEKHTKYVAAIHGRLKYQNNYNKNVRNVGTFASALFILSQDNEILSRFLNAFKDVSTIYKKMVWGEA